jgi:hypothetical protein
MARGLAQGNGRTSTGLLSEIPIPAAKTCLAGRFTFLLSSCRTRANFAQVDSSVNSPEA